MTGRISRFDSSAIAGLTEGKKDESRLLTSKSHDNKSNYEVIR